MQQKSKILALCGFALGALIIAGCASPSSSSPSAGALAPNTGGGMRATTRAVTLGATRESASRQPSHGWLSPEARKGKKLVYVSDQFNNSVSIYSARGINPSPIGIITDGISTPDGLAVDSMGNLYVANAGGSTVTVYPPGKTTPSTTYSPGTNPVSVLVGRDGTVYIAQGFLGCICITEYNIGSQNPKLTIPLDTTGGSPMDMTLDASNNLYVTLTAPAVYEFAPGQTTGTNLGLTGLTNPRGIQFDWRGNLVVVNDTLDFSSGTLNIYPPGKTSYTKQIVAGPQPFEATFGLYKALYVADVSYMESGYVAIFRDGRAAFKQIGMISKGLAQPLGVALSPDAR